METRQQSMLGMETSVILSWTILSTRLAYQLKQFGVGPETIVPSVSRSLLGLL